MKFEHSNYYNTLSHTLLQLPFGKFYLFDKFIITEIHPEIHFNWEMVEVLISELIDFYGEDLNIAYISNRTNSYSFDPNSWIKFEREYGFIIASAIVYYDQVSEKNATLEKHMAQNSIKRCGSLDKAIEWVLNLNEFRQAL